MYSHFPKNIGARFCNFIHLQYWLFMKKIVTLFSLLFMVGTAVAQIPNNSFETWSNATGYNVPAGWGTLNAKTNMMGAYTCGKGTPGYAGASYIQLVTTTVASVGTFPGVAVSGVLDTTTYQPVSGFASTARPVALVGACQYMASGTDHSHINILITKWNTMLSQRDTVAIASRVFAGMAMVWDTFSIPLTYYSGEVPDSAIITLSASGPVPAGGSYLYVDSLMFTGAVPAGVATVNVSGHAANLYPNPATGFTTLVYSSADAGNVTIQIVDVVGKSVFTSVHESVAGNNNIGIDVSGYPKGVYLVKVMGAGEVETQKLVIE